MRFLAMGLLAVFSLFTGAVAGALVLASLSEPEKPPASETLQSLQALLEKNPDDDALKEAIRVEDLRLRREFQRNRRRMKTGAYLLVFGLAAAVACARWYAALDRRRPTVRPVGERLDEERWIERRRVRLGGLLGLTAALALGVLMMHLVGIPRPFGAGEGPSGAELARKGARVGGEIPGDERATADRERFKENWPRFRGPSGMGLAKAGDWPLKWDSKTGENILWKVPVPIQGKSSPVIWGDRIFLTGADERRQEVICFDRSTGRLLWRTVVPPGSRWKPDEEEPDEMRKMTGYAAPTPATDGRRLYVTYASADVAALDFSGKVLWVRNMGEPRSAYGLASSLLVYKDTLIFQFDRGYSAEDKLSALLWINTENGDVVHREGRPVPNSWSTPVIVQTDVGTELLTCANPWVISYDVELRNELWRCRGLSGDVAASPVYADGLVFVTADNAQAMAIRTGGAGELTEEDIAWTAFEGLSDAASPVCNAKYFLQANGAGTVTCYDAKRGKLLWQRDFEDIFRASATLAGELVYLLDEKGVTHILRLADSYEPVGSGSLGEKAYATPAFVDSRIYFRTQKSLWCVGKKRP